MSKTMLFIDGENFVNKVEEVIKINGLDKKNFDIAAFKIKEVVDKALTGYSIDSYTYYTAKLQYHKPTHRQSVTLIERQRRMKTNFEKQGFNFLIAGHVRPQQVGSNTIFREKGVDVHMAVDLVSFACDKKMKTAILCSSDSDLQPAVKEIRRRGVEVVYLGFASNPNIGLTKTSNKSIFFRDQEILHACVPKP